jgi:hypothetical protein
MHLYSIEILPMVLELVLDPAPETPSMPSEGAPGQRFLNTVPCRPEPAFPRYVLANQREGCLAQVTRPPTRDWERLYTRWERERIPPPAVRNEGRHNAMAAPSEGRE